MDLTKEQIQYIKGEFSSMQSKEDFLTLLNWAKKILYQEHYRPIELRQLNYHINPKLNNKRYTPFTIKKKSGGERIINSPCKGLKQIQLCLNIILKGIYFPHEHAYGFITGKSIVDNARMHIGQLYIYNIDLKDFFPSIDQARVWGRLQYPPFCLDTKRNCQHIANMIAALCCHSMNVERKDKNGEWVKIKQNVLPQGAPTSPLLTNIICERLDYLLSAVAKRFGLRYSRYADDITFSSMHNVYQKNSDFLKEIHRIITEQRFTIKESKTRLQKEGYRQEVTGIIISKKLNVPQRYVKALRKWLYYWETYGYEKAYSFFCSSYFMDKGHIKKGNPNMASVIAGKLEYIKMVKGRNDATYLKLQERYNTLILKQSRNVIKDVLLIWEKEGIDKAMNYYYELQAGNDIVTDTPNDVTLS